MNSGAWHQPPGPCRELGQATGGFRCGGESNGSLAAAAWLDALVPTLIVTGDTTPKEREACVERWFAALLATYPPPVVQRATVTVERRRTSDVWVEFTVSVEARDEPR